MDEETFKRRTKKFALDTLLFAGDSPKSRLVEIIGTQLFRSASSVGANYRAACRGKSTADVIAKLAVVEEEADESLYWMELLLESGTVRDSRLALLMSEANEIVAMTVASIKTLRSSWSPTIRVPKSKI